MKIYKVLFITIAVTSGLFGCTLHPPGSGEVSVIPDAPESRADKLAKRHFQVGEEVKSIPFVSTVDGWGYIDNKALWVTTSPNRYYLLTLSFDCHELRWAESIALKARTSQLTWGDDVLVRGQPPGSCKIDHIYEMTREKPEAEEQ